MGNFRWLWFSIILSWKHLAFCTPFWWLIIILSSGVIALTIGITTWLWRDRSDYWYCYLALARSLWLLVVLYDSGEFTLIIGIPTWLWWLHSDHWYYYLTLVRSLVLLLDSGEFALDIPLILYSIRGCLPLQRKICCIFTSTLMH